MSEPRNIVLIPCERTGKGSFTTPQKAASRLDEYQKLTDDVRRLAERVKVYFPVYHPLSKCECPRCEQYRLATSIRERLR